MASTTEAFRSFKRSKQPVMTELRNRPKAFPKPRARPSNSLAASITTLTLASFWIFVPIVCTRGPYASMLDSEIRPFCGCARTLLHSSKPSRRSFHLVEAMSSIRLPGNRSSTLTGSSRDIGSRAAGSSSAPPSPSSSSPSTVASRSRCALRVHLCGLPDPAPFPLPSNVSNDFCSSVICTGLISARAGISAGPRYV